MQSTGYADTRGEIEHLLDYVAKTECSYERNGRTYTGPEARQHIERKHRHFASQIDSAEDFIRYSASKSEISGKKYKVHCPGDGDQFAGDWLLDELRTYRAQRR